MDELNELRPHIAGLLRQIDVPDDFILHPLHSGNNRVYRLDAEARSVLLKVYFQHPDDRRDRLGAEFAFSRFAWQQGLRQLPQPLACDVEHRLGLYEFVAGSKLTPGAVNEEAVRQALAFVMSLNRHRYVPEAEAVPRASEACFTLAAHLECVDRRVQRLSQIGGPTDIDQQARRFVEGHVIPAWQKVRETIAQGVANPELEVDRCLSPSDFGFHNALLDDQGILRFVDFEYAGWDDAVKLACDFFCQPQVPVPAAWFTPFVAELASGLQTPDLPERSRLLLPVYQIKWVCIMLNEFLPVGGQRRTFAQPERDAERRKEEQLRKAMGSLAEMIHGAQSGPIRSRSLPWS